MATVDLVCKTCTRDIAVFSSAERDELTRVTEAHWRLCTHVCPLTIRTHMRTHETYHMGCAVLLARGSCVVHVPL